MTALFAIPYRNHFIFSIQQCIIALWSRKKNQNIRRDAAMASVSGHEKLYTLNDIYSLPEGSRAELIDGHIYNMTPPTVRHLPEHISALQGNSLQRSGNISISAMEPVKSILLPLPYFCVRMIPNIWNRISL